MVGGRKRYANEDIIPAPDVSLPMFTMGQTARILNAPIWRVQKLLESPTFQISPSGQTGKGKGSRRLFSTGDIYRVGLALYLLLDGFTFKLVAEVLQGIEDEELFEPHNRFGILMRRDKTKRTIGFFPSGKAEAVRKDSDVYYTLDCGEVIEGIDRAIRAEVSSLYR